MTGFPKNLVIKLLSSSCGYTLFLRFPPRCPICCNIICRANVRCSDINVGRFAIFPDYFSYRVKIIEFYAFHFVNICNCSSVINSQQYLTVRQIFSKGFEAVESCQKFQVVNMLFGLILVPPVIIELQVAPGQFWMHQ